MCCRQAETVSICNAIKARYDAGIVNFKYDNTGVLEAMCLSVENMGSTNEDRIPDGTPTDISNTLLARDYKGLSNHSSNVVAEVVKIGGGLGDHQAGSVYDCDCISPTLMAGMSHGNTMPYITEVTEWKK